MKDFRLRDLIELLVLPLLTMAVYILWDMNKNINNLNIQVGVILAEGSMQKEDIKELKTRVLSLEKGR